MDIISLKKDLTYKMNKALEVLDRDLKGLRTGRASVNLLDPVIIEAYSKKMPLSHLASITTIDSRSINIQVWDHSITKLIVKTIIDSNIGVTPIAEGSNIRILIPPLTEDRRKEMAKLAYKYGEASKVSIRNIRRDINDNIKKLQKDKSISEDFYYEFFNEIQQLTDDYIIKIDEKVKKKEKEITII